MTEEQAGKLVDCIDYLINEIRRLRIDVAEGAHPSLAERIEAFGRRSWNHEPIHTYISRQNGFTFAGGAAISEYAMKMEELLIDLLDDKRLTEGFKMLITSRMGWK